jgi:pimeloyl-ACP methyl ester carboxylesterase
MTQPTSFFKRVLGGRKPHVDPTLNPYGSPLPPSRLSRTPHGLRSLVSQGVGTPTVVFESGLGNGKEVWSSVFHAISEKTHAIAYDRAGYGQSERSRLARDGHQLVRELRAMLHTEKIPPPYVLVGHSLGGTIVKLFARTYPNEVAGVVLVDARHSEFAKRCQQLGVHRLLYEPPAALFMMARAALRGELVSAPITMKQARRAGPFPPVPLIVITQTRASSSWPGGMGKAWMASQRSMIKMSALARYKVLDDSGHNVHKDRPDVVVRAVLNVVEAARYTLAKRQRAARLQESGQTWNQL